VVPVDVFLKVLRNTQPKVLRNTASFVVEEGRMHGRSKYNVTKSQG
jgi:hypothetical protein